MCVRTRVCACAHAHMRHSVLRESEDNVECHFSPSTIWVPASHYLLGLLTNIYFPFPGGGGAREMVQCVSVCCVSLRTWVQTLSSPCKKLGLTVCACVPRAFDQQRQDGGQSVSPTYSRFSDRLCFKWMRQRVTENTNYGPLTVSCIHMCACTDAHT